MQSPENLKNKLINEYAQKILERNNEKGIINNYIYNVKRIDKNTTIISIIEDENAVSHIKMTIIFSAIIYSVIISFLYVLRFKKFTLCV